MRRSLLVEVGEGLDGLRDEGEVASTALLRQLLHEVEQTGRQDSRAEEAQEYTRTDEVVTHVLMLPFLTPLSQTREHFPQLPARTNDSVTSESTVSSVLILSKMIVNVWLDMSAF